MGMDVYGKNPANHDGEYFRANVWSWRPIHQLSETVLKKELPWGTNDGEGFDSQDACNELAEKIEKYLKTFPEDEISIESDIRVTADGRFTKNGGRSAYYTDKEHVEKFCKFLRNCGGFQIC